MDCIALKAKKFYWKEEVHLQDEETIHKSYYKVTVTLVLPSLRCRLRLDCIMDKQWRLGFKPGFLLVLANPQVKPIDVYSKGARDIILLGFEVSQLSLERCSWTRLCVWQNVWDLIFSVDTSESPVERKHGLSK